MGQLAFRNVGSRSLLDGEKHLFNSSEDVDWKDEKLEQKTKSQLYDLFLKDKLVHIEKVEELSGQLIYYRKQSKKKYNTFNDEADNLK